MKDTEREEMASRRTADIIAALHGDRDALTKVRGTRYGSWSRTEEGIAAADRLAELDEMVNVSLDAELTAYETELARIHALLPPGVSIEQLVASWNRLHSLTLGGEGGRWFVTVGQLLDHLRDVKPL